MPNIWGGLTPDIIFQSLEGVISGQLTNVCRRRNSYVNRVWEVERENNHERLIAKFYRPGRWTKEMIAEEHQFLRELSLAEVPVIPPLAFDNQTLFAAGNIFFALFPKKGGRTMDEFDKETWKILGRLLAKLHLCGAKHSASSRLTWEPAQTTRQHLELILNSTYLLPDFKPAFSRIGEAFIKIFNPLFQGQEKILLHGDCHKGNLIVRPGEGLFLIDFDDLCLGSPVQDLWMLLPDTPEKSANELGWFLEGYTTFRDFNEQALALVPALRGMRIIHYVAWLATQHHDPDFFTHFPEAGTTRYWNETIKHLQELVYPPEE